MIDNGLPMHPKPDSVMNIYDQNFNGLGATIECFGKYFSDEKITRSKGKEVFTFQCLSTSAIYAHLKAENLVEFGGRWFRIKYLEDDEGIKGLTKFTCYALWYELSEGIPSPLVVATSTLSQVANQIVAPFGKWAKLVIPSSVTNKAVRGVTLKENSALYKLRYLAKQYDMELTFAYEEIIENELRYVKTVIFLQPYVESKIDFPLVVEENLRHVSRTEDSRSLVTAYKLTGKQENEGDEFTFASINGGNPYLVDTSWFTTRQMKPRIIPKSKQDDRFTVKQNMLDAARAYLDIYAKPLIGYEADAILYSKIPDLHHSQLVIDDSYQITEWRKVTSRSIDYDDLTNSTIIFEDPRQDLMDLLNDDGDGALSYQGHEQARTIVRFAHGPNGENMNAESGPYIGVISTTKPTSALTAQDFTWTKVKGEDGAKGADGRPGRDGVDGVAGKNGVGIIDTTVSYFLSTSGSSTPTSGWTEQVPSLIKGRYLWTKTTWRYSDGSQETGYNVSYIAQDGNKGNDGLPGADGVGITRTVIEYARHTSGTSAPSSGWQSQVPNVPAGQFLWTRTTWHYTNDTSEQGFSVSKAGETGAKGDPGKDGIAGAPGVGIRSTSITYGLSANETTQPTSWTNSVPTLIKGQYLWTRTIWTYTDGNTETGFQKNYIARDGNRGNDGIAGKDGVGIRSTVIQYAGSSNGTTPPTSGWQDQVPTVSQGHYLWTKTTWNYSDSTSEVGYNVSRMGADGAKGDKGDPGRDGVAGAPGVGIRSTAITYGLSASESVQPTSWSSSVPTLVKGQFLWTKTVWTYTNNTSETGYSKNYIARDGNNGSNGVAGKDGVGIRATVITYAASTSGTSAPATGWQTQVPSVPNGQFLWTKTVWTYTDGSNETGYNVSRMGADGPRGIPGEKGADGRTSYQHFAYSDNPDGTGMTLDDKGQRYEGFYQDFTAADSSNKDSYRWRDRYGGIEPGVENLLINSLFERKYNTSDSFTVGGKTYTAIQLSDWATIYNRNLSNPTTIYHALVNTEFLAGASVMEFNESDGSRNWKAINQSLIRSDLTEGTYYFSADVYATGPGTRISIGFYYFNSSGKQNFYSGQQIIRPSITGKWHRVGIAVSLTVDIDWTKDIRFYIYSYNFSSNSILYLKKPKLAKGNSDTGHSLHRLDFDRSLAGKADASQTDSQLNAIIQKQLTMQAELEAAATMANLSDLQKAVAAYIEQNDRDKKESEAEIIDAARRITAHEEKLGGMSNLKTFLDKYIRESEEGMIFGSKSSDAQLKITNDRISMHTGNTEVMSISQGVITINNGVFTVTLQVGRFKTESYADNPDINVCRYIG